MEIFVEADSKEVNNLRGALYGLYKFLEQTKESETPAGKEFFKYLTVAHLLDLKNTYEKKSIHVLHARISISLLRYCDLVRLDKL